MEPVLLGRSAGRWIKQTLDLESLHLKNWENIKILFIGRLFGLLSRRSRTTQLRLNRWWRRFKSWRTTNEKFTKKVVFELTPTATLATLTALEIVQKAENNVCRKLSKENLFTTETFLELDKLKRNKGCGSQQLQLVTELAPNLTRVRVCARAWERLSGVGREREKERKRERERVVGAHATIEDTCCVVLLRSRSR